MNKNMKKTIIMSLIYSLVIGCLTLFIGALAPIDYSDSNAVSTEEEVVNSTIDNNNIIASEDYSISSMSLGSSVDEAERRFNQALTPSPIPTSTPTPSPTAAPVYELEKGDNPKINSLFNDYYVAINGCDLNQLSRLVTDTESMKPIKVMEKETIFIDDIRNIVCYYMKSYEDGAYIVYVTYDIKYMNIKNTYPKLDKFYLITDDNGDLKIFTSKMDEYLKNYYDERDQDEEVTEIKESIAAKQEEVLEKDSDLKAYLDALYG